MTDDLTNLRTDANPELEAEPDEVIEAPSEEEADEDSGDVLPMPVAELDDELDQAEADADAPTLAE